MMRVFYAFAILSASLGVTACILDTEGGLAVPPTSSGTGGSSSSSTGTAGDGGTTSGTGGTTSSSSTSGTGGDGGTGANDPEDCLDGEDNDGDDDVDCADTDCQPDFECVAEAPSGWTGYAYALMTDLPAPAPTPCPDASQPELHFDKPSGPASCSTCSCGAVQGVSCGYPEMDCYDNSSSCSNGADESFNDKDGACHDFSSFWNDHNDWNTCEMTQAAGLTGSGSCTPSVVVPAVPPPWGAEVRTCALAGPFGAGCNGSEVCVPRAVTNYPELCVTQQGEHSCPSGWNGGAVYGGSSDDRSCSPCTCSGVNGASCTTGTIIVYDQNTCGTGGDGPIAVTQTCTDISYRTDNYSGSYELLAGTLQGGSCSPNGGQPTGAINPTDPLTVCCLP